MKRPLEITLWSILYFAIGFAIGTLGVLIGVFELTLVAKLAKLGMLDNKLVNDLLMSLVPLLLGAMLYISIGYGLWKGRVWAWKMVIALLILGIAKLTLATLLGIGVVTIFSVYKGFAMASAVAAASSLFLMFLVLVAIPTISLYRLTRPHIKRYFFVDIN